MRITKLLLSLMSCSLMLIAKANAATVLDGSQDVFFDEFSASTFTTQLLQAKNKYANGDLVIGGSLQSDLQTWHGNPIFISPAGIYNDGGGLYLTQATVDAMGNISNWLTSFISIGDTHAGTGGANGNYYYLPQAFLLFGNLSSFPVYLNVGINSIPFGVFTGSGPWDTPLTANYFYPSQAPQISAGYSKNGWNVVATEFRDEVNYQNHAIGNISYNNTIGVFSYTLGAGYMNSLKSNAAGGPGSSRNRKSAGMAQNLGGIEDFNGSVQYRQVGMAMEYVHGSDKLLLNTYKPSAYSVEATYTPKIAGADTAFGLTYSKTLDMNHVPGTLSGQDAIPLALPGINNAWSLGVSRQVMVKNVVLGLEVGKISTYSDKNSYTGTTDLMLYL